MEEAPLQGQSTDTSLTKSSLEIQKLQEEILKVQTDRRKADLEINELARWYRRPSTLQPIAAIIIALVGTAVGVANGWFSTNLERLRIEEDKLKIGNTDLGKERDRLEKQVATLSEQLEGAAQNAQSLAYSLKSAEAKASTAEAKASELVKSRAEIGRLSEELNRVGVDASRVALASRPLSTSQSATVADALSGKGIADAEITLRDGGALLSADRSDASGAFRLQFEFLNRASALITIIRPGYETKVWTRDSMPTSRRFELQPR